MKDFFLASARLQWLELIQASFDAPRSRLMMGMVCKRRLCDGGYGFVVVYGEEVMDEMNLWRIMEENDIGMKGVILDLYIMKHHLENLVKLYI